MAANIFNPRTHAALAYRREGPRLRFGRWLEVGNARFEQAPCPHCGEKPPPLAKGHIFLDRLPIGGFTGYVMVTPIGSRPALPTPQLLQLIEQGGIEGSGDETADEGDA